MSSNSSFVKRRGRKAPREFLKTRGTRFRGVGQCDVLPPPVTPVAFVAESQTDARARGEECTLVAAEFDGGDAASGWVDVKVRLAVLNVQAAVRPTVEINVQPGEISSPDAQSEGRADVLDRAGDRADLTFVVLLFEDFGGATDEVNVVFQDVVAGAEVRDIGLYAQILDEGADAGADASAAADCDGERSVPGHARNGESSPGRSESSSS